MTADDLYNRSGLATAVNAAPAHYHERMRGDAIRLVEAAFADRDSRWHKVWAAANFRVSFPALGRRLKVVLQVPADPHGRTQADQ